MIFFNQSAKNGGSSTEPLEAADQLLAKFMLRYSPYGQFLTVTDLTTIQSLSHSSIEIELVKNEMTAKMNKIFYHCFVKEIVRFKLSFEVTEEFSGALAQIRAVKLIVAGKISMKQVFDQDAPFGVFTDQGILKNKTNLLKKIENINQLYFDTFYNKSPTATAFTITKRAELHKELQEGYGGETDSDGEGYDSDTAEKQYPIAYRPF